MNILVVTNEKAFGAKLLQKMDLFIQEKHLKGMEIFTESPIPFAELNKWKDSGRCYLLVLDMRQQKSWQLLLEQISAYFPYSHLILLTAEQKIPVFSNMDSISAAFWAEDPALGVKLCNYIQKIHKKIFRINDNLWTRENGIYAPISFQSIYYMESMIGKHKCRIYYQENGQIQTKELRISMQNLKSLCPPPFLQVHASLLVNLSKVIKIDSKIRILYLKDNLSCGYARVHYGEICRQLKEGYYCREK